MKKCPVCDSEKWEQVYKIREWDIVKCVGCGFAKISPFPERVSRPEFYSKESGDKREEKKKRNFFRQLSAKSKTLFKNLTKRDKQLIFYKKLLKDVKPGSTLLDVACADGAFIGAVKKSFKCTGVDISDHLTDLARKAHPDSEIITGNFLEAALDGRKFDAITIIALLEHLDDPLLAIQKSYDMLNPGGALFLKTVNYGCLNRVLMKGKWTGFRPPDHMVYFNPKNLKTLFEKVGFTRTRMSASPFNDNMYCDAWR